MEGIYDLYLDIMMVLVFVAIFVAYLMYATLRGWAHKETFGRTPIRKIRYSNLIRQEKKFGKRFMYLWLYHRPGFYYSSLASVEFS
jgi:hypothetical protein